jgi:hypothetical protein
LSVRYNADETKTLEQTLAKLTEPILIDSDDELPTYNAPSVAYRECHATYDAEGIRAMQQPSAQWTGPIVIDSDDEPATYNAPSATYHEYRATYNTEEVGLEQEASAQLGGSAVVDSDDEPLMLNVPSANRHESRATYNEDRNGGEESNETGYAVRMTTSIIVESTANTSKISTDRLLDPTVSTQDILDDVAQLCPQLDLTTERMQTFPQLLPSLEQTYSPLLFPAVSTGDGFPQFDPELDQEWKRHVANEPLLAPGSYPEAAFTDSQGTPLRSGHHCCVWRAASLGFLC